MIPQYFKGDATELKYDAAGKKAFDVTNVALDAYAEGAYQSDPFLLMLYDEGRMPFADRVPRDSFVSFIKEALDRFPFTGTFESYLFILEKIFGEGSGVLFNVPGPGEIEIAVNAASTLEFNFETTEIVEGDRNSYSMVDHLGNNIIFGGVSGIDSESELSMLLAEIAPAGIFMSVTLAFFALYNFVDDEDNSIVDHLGNQIVFVEN